MRRLISRGTRDKSRSAEQISRNRESRHARAQESQRNFAQARARVEKSRYRARSRACAVLCAQANNERTRLSRVLATRSSSIISMSSANFVRNVYVRWPNRSRITFRSGLSWRDLVRGPVADSRTCAFRDARAMRRLITGATAGAPITPASRRATTKGNRVESSSEIKSRVA